MSGVPEVVALYLYGSAARGELARDVDLAVVVHGAVSHALIERWAAELQRRALPRGPEIDLRVASGAAPRFRATVVREGRLLYARTEGARRAFETRALSDWFDFQPTWERMRRRMLDRWTRG